MSDISKCDGKSCDLANLCWRFQAPASRWQSFIDPKERGTKCAHYWPNPQNYPDPIPPFTDEGGSNDQSQL